MKSFQQTAHGPERDAEREKAAYDKLLAKYEALQFAAEEGVFQVTIQSDSGSITVPVSFLDGHRIATQLVEGFMPWINHLEQSLRYSLEAVGDELRAERKEEESCQQQRNKEAAAERAADAQRELAQATGGQADTSSEKGGAAV